MAQTEKDSRMKIVVLDGFTLNPGDLDWGPLSRFGEFQLYDRTPPALTLERCLRADIVLTNKAPLSGEVLERLPDLKYIGVLATGYNIIDIETAKRRNIIVSNVPGYGTNSVVQMTFALLLELCLHVQRHSDAVHSGRWTQSPDFCFWDFPLIELSGKTMGIIGFGDIGEKVGDLAAAFGMKVLGSRRHHTDQSNRRDFAWASVEEIFERSDVVSLHCPLTPETKGLVNQKTLSSMKSTAFLINTSRGPLIVEEDIAEALNKDRIAGAGIDVLSAEPPGADNPLLKAKNCIITPHIAWASREARTRLMNTAAENLQAFLNGNPVHVVSR
ncbi:MAG TPA: D-2-hydroxyacid dehydrogenase [Puia sp.]|nr:D-2-hydroxyacid dehydrogenase [Puia sp.]